MSEAITLIIRDETFAIDNAMLDAERVVGIIVPHMPAMLEHGTVLTGDEQEVELCLPGKMNERLVDFYERCRARFPAAGFNNCHLFVTHVLGLTALFNEWAQYRWEDTEPADGAHLSAGQPYAVVQSRGRPVHSLLGTNYADANLSVLGIRQPLVLSENRQLRDAYAGRLARLLRRETELT